MASFEIPDVIADPPLALPRDTRVILFPEPPDRLLVRWLAHLGADRGHPTVERLAALLDTPEAEIASVLIEANFLRAFKQEMLYFDPVPHEIEAKLRYARIARLTYRYMRRYTAGRKGFIPSVDDSWRFSFLIGFVKGQELASVYASRRGGSLSGEWEAWHVTWRTMVSRSPLLELRERMRDISETHLAQSWPFDLERVIDEWVERGTLEPKPLDDRWNILNRAFYERLRELRYLCGGWYYWDDDVGGVVFATRPEWEAKRVGWRSLNDQPPVQRLIRPSDNGDWVLGDDARWRWILRTPARSYWPLRAPP